MEGRDRRLFGYVRPFKPEMKMREFETFQAVYCGLCKELSHVYGPFASLTLSYDFTFIATLSLGLSEQEGRFQRCACAANPLRKKNVPAALRGSHLLRFRSDADDLLQAPG